MAKIENKNMQPVVPAIANFCCCAILGYILIGQTQKGVFPLITVVILSILASIGSFFILPGAIFGILAFAVAIMAAIDVYLVAEGVQKGEELDEHEYRLEFFYKIMSLVDKKAVINPSRSVTLPTSGPGTGTSEPETEKKTGLGEKQKPEESEEKVEGKEGDIPKESKLESRIPPKPEQSSTDAGVPPTGGAPGKPSQGETEEKEEDKKE